MLLMPPTMWSAPASSICIRMPGSPSWGPAPRSQSTPGRYHGTRGYRRHLARAFQNTRRAASVYLARFRPQRLPPMPADWLTVAELLSKYDQKVAINMAYILGNSPVRIWGVGWHDRPATTAELQDMKSVVREAMEEGAWGLSTGLDYPPGAYADTDELAPSEVSARLGGFYHTHTRASLRAKGLLAPWEEALDIGWRSGSPVHLTHYRQSAQGVGSHLDYLGLVDNARDQGLDVTFDCYTYPYSGTMVAIGLPFWAKDGGPERTMAAPGPGRPRPDETRDTARQARKQLADQFHQAAQQTV